MQRRYDDKTMMKRHTMVCLMIRTRSNSTSQATKHKSEWPYKLACYYIPELVFPLPKESQPLQPVGYIISAPVVLSFFIEVASLFCCVCGWGGGYYIFIIHPCALLVP